MELAKTTIDRKHMHRRGKNYQSSNDKIITNNIPILYPFISVGFTSEPSQHKTQPG